MRLAPAKAARTAGTLSVLCMLAFATPPATSAEAATARLSGAQLSFTASLGEVNRVTVALESSSYRITDTGAMVTAGTGCSPVSFNAVVCPSTRVTSIKIDAGDLDDVAA